MSAHLPAGDIGLASKDAASRPRKLAGPWAFVSRAARPEAFASHSSMTGIWVRPQIGVVDAYVAAVALCADLSPPAQWAAFGGEEDGSDDLGQGWEESIGSGKMQADVRLLAAGWTLLV